MYRVEKPLEISLPKKQIWSTDLVHTVTKLVGGQQTDQADATILDQLAKGQWCGARLRGFKTRVCHFKVPEIPVSHSISSARGSFSVKLGQLQSSHGACRSSKKAQHMSTMVTCSSISPQVFLGIQNQTEPPSHPAMLTRLIKLHFSCEVFSLRPERNSKAKFLPLGLALDS